MSQNNICSEDSSTERSQSVDNVIFNFDFDALPDSRECAKEVRGNINNIIQRQYYSDLKFEFEYVGEKLYINPSCVDQKEYPILRLHLDGVHNVSNIKCLLDMSGFALVTKTIEFISLVGCTIYLEQFTVHSKTYRSRVALFMANHSCLRVIISSFLFLDFRILIGLTTVNARIQALLQISLIRNSITS
ncbi:Hypothetical_protein [Hexamita inflata]|uniref:Hypothetical_protein n=1 Tax=Hexamita inflata TaxID=28002 RepID=A0AA86TZ49_9EUKA|nr:Hypothetical protein HINF_LOCUS20192 [Hexamita inflata]